MGKQENKPRKMEFSKKLIIFATVIFAASWLIAVFSWFSMGEIPSYLLQYAHLLYGGCCVSYYCKSAYENKPKIERRGGDEG